GRPVPAASGDLPRARGGRPRRSRARNGPSPPRPHGGSTLQVRNAPRRTGLVSRGGSGNRSEGRRSARAHRKRDPRSASVGEYGTDPRGDGGDRERSGVDRSGRRTGSAGEARSGAARPRSHGVAPRANAVA